MSTLAAFLLLHLLAPLPIDLDGISIERARHLHGRLVVASFISIKPMDLWQDRQGRNRTILGAADRDGLIRGTVLPTPYTSLTHLRTAPPRPLRSGEYQSTEGWSRSRRYNGGWIGLHRPCHVARGVRPALPIRSDYMHASPVRLGVAGCGGFGLFALQQFTQVPGVTLVGMAGTHRPAALAAAARFGVGNADDLGDLLRRDDVDLVYIATPPFLHFPQALAALEAGKHVLVEKPLALTVAQADELVAVARHRDRLLVANLMQRYNPLYDAVRRLVETRVLGDVLHGYFENHASDENLPPEHWFWDRGKSGGIFVEHGVHFFDLLAGWLGPGRVEAAQVGIRPGIPIEEHVHATVRYGDAALVNFYHGFHQAGRMDRQELRLVFERGDVTLSDWVPTRARVHALADEAQTRQLCDLFPGARLDVAASYSGTDRACRGRGKALDAYQVIDLSFGEGVAKSPLYGRLLRSMMADQVAWVRDRTHRRVVTEANGRDSLAMACAADVLAHRTGAGR